MDFPECCLPCSWGAASFPGLSPPAPTPGSGDLLAQRRGPGWPVRVYLSGKGQQPSTDSCPGFDLKFLVHKVAEERGKILIQVKGIFIEYLLLLLQVMDRVRGIKLIRETLGNYFKIVHNLGIDYVCIRDQYLIPVLIDREAS